MLHDLLDLMTHDLLDLMTHDLLTIFFPLLQQKLVRKAVQSK